MKFKVKLGEKEYQIDLEEKEDKVRVRVNDKEFLFSKKEKIEKVSSLSVRLPQKREFKKKEVLAPISGIISEIFVKEKEVVKKGERLMILSAMKMENEISAHQEGRIKNILVKKGQKVNQGEVLIVLE